uniref:GntR family transcriptional regulator n=1 Tax=Cupriavidus yeoncheonensis TaxID=1462994 RepID=UPI003F4997EF
MSAGRDEADYRKNRRPMSRLKTTNTPELHELLSPLATQNPVSLAVERVLMRGNDWSASVADQIAIRLAGLITIDVIHAGQRLLEKDISEVLQVSRAPVREALRILERERLIEFRARRGAVVTALDQQDMRDIYIVREALFVILFRELMEDRPGDLEAFLNEHLPRVAKAAEESPDAYTSATFLTNIDMADLSGNRLIADLLNSISLRTLRYVRLGLASHPAVVEKSLKSWRALHRAVVKRDIDSVLQIAGKRVDITRESSTQVLHSSEKRGSDGSGSGRRGGAGTSTAGFGAQTKHSIFKR